MSTSIVATCCLLTSYTQVRTHTGWHAISHLAMLDCKAFPSVANRCLVYELSIPGNPSDFRVKIQSSTTKRPRGLGAGARTDDTRAGSLPASLYMNRQDLDQTTAPFIQSYSILKFDYKDTCAVIRCKIPDGEGDGMKRTELHGAEFKKKCSSLKTESVSVDLMRRDFHSSER